MEDNIIIPVEPNDILFIDNSQNVITKKYTLCFASMCKNEEKCILETLNSVYKFIDYWVICDTGSTDNTIEIIETFFEEKNIPGELHNDKWVNFGHNKTLMFQRCYKKTDFILHMDADDLFVGEIDVNNLNLDISNHIGYFINIKRGTFAYKDVMLFNNHFKWKVSGVAHNIFACIDNYKKLANGNLSNQPFYILSRDLGNRSNDSDKYLKDAIALKEQFFNTLILDPDGLNRRSLFYTAQSYYDCKYYKEAGEYYRLYTLLKDTWDEEVYESYKRIVQCMIFLDLYSTKEIIAYAKKGIELFPDRAEIYFIMGHYFLSYKKYELAYFNIKKASTFNLENVKNKYSLFIDEYCYGDNLTYLLTILSFETNRIQDGLVLYNSILDLDQKQFLKNNYSNLIRQ
jgi:hypothetical protein